MRLSQSKQTSASVSDDIKGDGDLDPILWVDNLAIGEASGSVGMGGAGLCHIEKEGLRFLVPIGREGNAQHVFYTGI